MDRKEGNGNEKNGKRLGVLPAWDEENLWGNRVLSLGAAQKFGLHEDKVMSVVSTAVHGAKQLSCTPRGRERQAPLQEGGQLKSNL